MHADCAEKESMMKIYYYMPDGSAGTGIFFLDNENDEHF